MSGASNKVKACSFDSDMCDWHNVPFDDDMDFEVRSSSSGGPNSGASGSGEQRPSYFSGKKYSQLSANGHSRKRTALFTDAFSNPCFSAQSNSVFTQSRERTLSRKGTRTPLKMKIGFSFCLRSLISGHNMYTN